MGTSNKNTLTIDKSRRPKNNYSTIDSNRTAMSTGRNDMTLMSTSRNDQTLDDSMISITNDFNLPQIPNIPTAFNNIPVKAK